MSCCDVGAGMLSHCFEQRVQCAYVMQKSLVSASWSIISNCLFRCIFMERMAAQKSISKMSSNLRDQKIGYWSMLRHVRLLFNMLTCFANAEALLMQNPGQCSVTFFPPSPSFFLPSFSFSSLPSISSVSNSMYDWRVDVWSSHNTEYF